MDDWLIDLIALLTQIRAYCTFKVIKIYFIEDKFLWNEEGWTGEELWDSFTGWMLFLTPNRQCQSTEGCHANRMKVKHSQAFHNPLDYLCVMTEQQSCKVRNYNET